MFSIIMEKRLFLRPKDNRSCSELGFISLLLYFRLLNRSRVMICPGFLLRVLSFNFYSTCFFKRVNFQSNLFKKIQLLNFKITEQLSWIHYSFSWEQSFVLGSSPLIVFLKVLAPGCCVELSGLFTAQERLAKGWADWNSAHALLVQPRALALGCLHLEEGGPFTNLHRGIYV